MKPKHQLFERFSNVCIVQGLDPQKKIEKLQLEYVASSLSFNEQLTYQIKNDIDSDPVKISGREGNFILLDNGNKIHALDFEKMYEGLDPVVKNVLDRIENEEFWPKFEKKETDVNSVDPIEFLHGGDLGMIRRIANDISRLSTSDYKFSDSDRGTTVKVRENPFLGEDTSNFFGQANKIIGKKEIRREFMLSENGLTSAEERKRQDMMMLTGTDPFKERVEKYRALNGEPSPIRFGGKSFTEEEFNNFVGIQYSPEKSFLDDDRTESEKIASWDDGGCSMGMGD